MHQLRRAIHPTWLENDWYTDPTSNCTISKWFNYDLTRLLECLNLNFRLSTLEIFFFYLHKRKWIESPNCWDSFSTRSHLVFSHTVLFRQVTHVKRKNQKPLRIFHLRDSIIIWKWNEARDYSTLPTPSLSSISLSSILLSQSLSLNLLLPPNTNFVTFSPMKHSNCNIQMKPNTML